jgi:uncharacterized protein (DUF1499 family)
MWKWIKRIVIAALVLAAATVLAGQFGLFKGQPPSDLGVREGRLKAPAGTPNSVSSQASLWPGHPQAQAAQIAPLALKNGDGPATMAALLQVVRTAPGAVVVKSEPDYLYAQFTTPLMKYVDDVEFWLDPAAGVVQVRSASRLGASDLGANRQRVEAIRAHLAQR